VRIGGKLISVAIMVAFAGAAVGRSRAQERPLPDADVFLSRARAHLQTDRQLLSQYTFLERETKIHLSKFGTLTTGPVQVFEVYPGLEPDDTYRRLIEVDGRPRDRAELEKEDRRRQKHVLDELERRRREDPDARERRLQSEAKAHHQDEETLDDLLRVYTFTLVERQAIDGHPVIVIDFVPRPNAAPKTADGKDMTKVKGRAWVSEDDYQIVRVSVDVLKDFSVAWFIGRLYAGTTASYERRKINNEIWLPSRLRINASGRAFIRKFHIDTVTEYSDYRKFSVETDTEFRKSQE
jgi:hypothetical protein